MPSAQAHRSLAIGTALGDDVLIVDSFVYKERLGRLFQIDVELSSDRANIKFDDIVGTNATIRMATGKGENRFFNGNFSRFSQVRLEGRSACYRATLAPWFWFLTRTADCRIFQKMTVPDIVKKVFRGHGLNDFAERLSGTYSAWEYCVQYRETDFNFVSRLLEQEGIYYFFEHEDGAHKLVLCDSGSSHKPCPGAAKLPFRSERTGVSQGEYLFDWRLEAELQPGQYALTDFNFKTPKANLVGKSKISRPHAFSDFEIFDFPGEYEQQGEGEKHYAKVRIEELQVPYQVFSAETTSTGVFAGGTVEVTDHVRDDQNRKYLVTQATIHAHTEAHDSGSAAQTFACSFSGIAADRPFRAARITPKPVVQGIQTAIVVGPAGEEIYTDEFGRIKLQFPWDRAGEANENSSCWVRVAQGWAGKNWGSIYLPRIGQEVIVEFVEGDPDHPLVTGSVYNAETMPPYPLPAEKTKSTLKSNSTKGGSGFNEIRLEDKKGSEQIFIHGQKDMDVRVRNNLTETNYGNRDVRVGWEKDGASGGNYNTLVKLDANTHVKGGQFEMVDKDLNQTVKGDVVQDHQKNQSLMVGQDYTLNAQQVIIETGKVISHKSGKITVEGAQGVHIKGLQVCIEGSTGVSLKVGGNFVSINPGGVFIKGAMVMINTGGAALPVEAAQPVPEAAIQDPLEAKIADDGKTGKKTAAKATPAKQPKRALKPIKAPPTPPGPKPVASGASSSAIAAPPPISTQTKTCGGPYELQDEESSGQRKGAGLKIDLAPASLFGGDSIVIKSSNGCSCSGPTIELGDKKGLLNAPLKVDGWSLATSNQVILISRLGKAVPKTLPLRLVCGKDKSQIDSGEVRVYPSDKIEIKFDSEELSKKFPSIDSMLKGLATALSKCTGKEVDPYKGLQFNTPLGHVKVEAPKLAFNYEAQWKEYSAGNTGQAACYYYWKAGISIDLSAEFKLDVLAAAATATGVGASVVSLVNYVRDAIKQDDPIIYLGFKAEIKGSGSMSFEEKIIGSIEIKGTGTVSLGAGLQIKEVVEISLQASTEISSSATGQGSSTGFEMKYEFLKWEGFDGKASVKITVGKFFSVGYDKTVKLLDGAGPLSEGTFPKETDAKD